MYKASGRTELWLLAADPFAQSKLPAPCTETNIMLILLTKVNSVQFPGLLVKAARAPDLSAASHWRRC